MWPLSPSATVEGSPGTGSQRGIAPSWAGPLLCKTNKGPDATLFKAYAVPVLTWTEELYWYLGSKLPSEV